MGARQRDSAMKETGKTLRSRDKALRERVSALRLMILWEQQGEQVKPPGAVNLLQPPGAVNLAGGLAK